MLTKKFLEQSHSLLAIIYKDHRRDLRKALHHSTVLKRMSPGAASDRPATERGLGRQSLKFSYLCTTKFPLPIGSDQQTTIHCAAKKIFLKSKHTKLHRRKGVQMTSGKKQNALTQNSKKPSKDHAKTSDDTFYPEDTLLVTDSSAAKKLIVFATSGDDIRKNISSQ